MIRYGFETKSRVLLLFKVVHMDPLTVDQDRLINCAEFEAIIY